MLNSQSSSDAVLIENSMCKSVRTIRLRRNGVSPLGFAIRGGWEHGTGIYVSEVYTNSEAEKEGLKPGDQILRVNGFSIEQAIHDEVISLIKSATKIILKVKSVGMIPVKENRTEPIQWRMCSEQQKQQQNQQTNQQANQQTNQQIQQVNSIKLNKRKQFKQKTKSKCPIHSSSEDTKTNVVPNLILNENKLLNPKTNNSIGSAGSSPTSSVSSKSSSSSITSSTLSSCSKMIAKSCKISLTNSSQKSRNLSKLNGFYSRSLSNLTNPNYIDAFNLNDSSNTNFTRNNSASNINLSYSSSSQLPSSSTDDSTLELKNKYSKVYINLKKGESLGCSVVKGPTLCPGIFIQTVKPNGAAQKAGLEVGDQIVCLNGISFLAEHISFAEAIDKIKSCHQMKFNVKKKGADKFLNENLKTKNLNTSSKIKNLSNQESSSSSCNESLISSPILNRHSNNHKTSTYCLRNPGIPYYRNKFSNRHNLNSNYHPLNSLNLDHFNSTNCLNSRNSWRKNLSQYRSLNNLLVHNTHNSTSTNNTYGKRISGYHSPVCIRHSNQNYYSQSENDYSMYEMEERNEIENKIDLLTKPNQNRIIDNSFFSQKLKTSNIRNNKFKKSNCENCDCFIAKNSKKSSLNSPFNNDLIKQKLYCKNLNCNNLTFHSNEICVPNCPNLCTILSNQMNTLQLTYNDAATAQHMNLENKKLILNQQNQLYEKMRLEEERLALERKKLENEQIRLQEEKDQLEREKKKLESLKQNDELKSISGSSSVSTNCISTNQSLTSSDSQNMGFLDEIKKLAERRTCENSLITDTLNKTRFNTNPNNERNGAIRLLPIVDSNNKIKQLHPDDEKRKQHELLMEEFRAAHQRMFGNNSLKSPSLPRSSTETLSCSKSNFSSSIVSSSSTNHTTPVITSNSLSEVSSFNQNDSFKKDSIKTQINSISNLEKIVINETTQNLSEKTTCSKNSDKNLPIPPPPPPTIINNNSNVKNLITFGKIAQTNGQLNINKNYSNSKLILKSSSQETKETVKILRTSSPNKKGPAPPPPLKKSNNNITALSTNFSNSNNTLSQDLTLEENHIKQPDEIQKSSSSQLERSNNKLINASKELKPNINQTKIFSSQEQVSIKVQITTNN